MDQTLTETLDQLGVEYTVVFPEGGGVDIQIWEQVIQQD